MTVGTLPKCCSFSWTWLAEGYYWFDERSSDAIADQRRCQFPPHWSNHKAHKATVITNGDPVGQSLVTDSVLFSNILLPNSFSFWKTHQMWDYILLLCSLTLAMSISRLQKWFWRCSDLYLAIPVLKLLVSHPWVLLVNDWWVAIRIMYKYSNSWGWAASLKHLEMGARTKSFDQWWPKFSRFSAQNYHRSPITEA